MKIIYPIGVEVQSSDGDAGDMITFCCSECDKSMTVAKDACWWRKKNTCECGIYWDFETFGKPTVKGND